MATNFIKTDRASQFMPFDALKGFREALLEKEKILANKIELVEETENIINNKLININKNDIVEITYYEGNCYIKIIGMVSKIDVINKYVQVVDKKIQFKNIYDISS